ncbi:unnamed protein product [Dibothriocephalus latus]|uniref:Uncharacterized protein n=1 Tax=Dibothriocephalus latus TaxID=60516 RepID=A0A3P7L543_DIBLA|nr:unnamed protein product [Dibothriocephalus latus]
MKCNSLLTPQRRKRNNSVVEAERTLLFDCPKHGQILFLTTFSQSKSAFSSPVKKSSAPSLVWHRSEVETTQAKSKQVSPSKKEAGIGKITSSDPNVADCNSVVSEERIQSHFSPEPPFTQQRDACSCQSDCHSQRAEEEHGHASIGPMSHQTEDSTALREADLDEQRRIALNNMVICVVSISAWSPFMLATFLKVMCNYNECSFSITSITLLKFKWLTYLSSVFYLLGFILVDRKLRTHVNVCFEQRLRMWQQ